MLLEIFRFCLDSKSEFNELVKKFDLTFSQWQVLKVINLSTTKSLTINEIVDELNADKATISLLVKKLKEKDMVISTTNAKDKRKVYISLTEKMVDNCLQLKKVEEEFTLKIFSNLSEDERKQLEDIFSKI